jgi:hypothetical protein
MEWVEPEEVRYTTSYIPGVVEKPSRTQKRGK